MKKQPRKGRQVRFTEADGVLPPHVGDPVVGLRFNIEARYGGVVRVDLTGFRPRPLAIAFAAALRRQAELGGRLGAAKTIQQHIHAYHSFFAYLRDHSSATRPRDLHAHNLDKFEIFLKANGKSTIRTHTILAKIICALRSINADRPGTLNESLFRRLTYTSAQPWGRSQPREAYSPFVARQLRDAAREDITKIVQRIGQSLFIDQDEELQLAIDRVDTKIRSDGRIGTYDRAFSSVYFMARRRGFSFSTLSYDIHSRFHLTSRDVIPMLTFLSLETGLEIECCKTLTVDCLKNPGLGTVEIAYLKRRARGAEHKSLRIRDGGIGTPGGLIRKVIEITTFTRRFVPSDCLWVYHYTGPKMFRAGVDRLQDVLDQWVRSRNIVDDDGRPLHLLFSRLRKTHKALWYLKTEGHMARFAVGHTPEVAARHYADLPSLRPLHEATIAAALSEVVTNSGPTILGPAEEIQRRENQNAIPIGTSALPSPSDGAQDVWLATCSGFTKSPFGQDGSPCPQPFWGCLECHNAVITARKLPAILAFLAFIENERDALPAVDWRAKFGRAHDRITLQVLPTFSQAVIDRARTEIPDARLYLPPEARA